MKRLLLIAALAAFAAALAAFRPYDQGARSKAAWMTVSAIKTGQEYYLEVAQDGQAIMREETSKSLITRRGSIKPQLIKDFFREIENSEIINSQNIKRSKMVFYRGDLLRVSAYISGELTRTEAPLNNFGEAFSYAFSEVRKAVAVLPQETAVNSFLRAEPVEGEELDSFRAKAEAGREVKNIETEDLKKVKPLLAAIKEPYRLVPIENPGALKELQDFISSRQLYGLRALFYVPSTRGTYKCQLLDVQRKQAVAPAPQKGPTRKPAAAEKTKEKTKR
ncbi:MAG: hypothetical protein Q7R35_11800 [Elusimicrobiota bacterium]|nr:hypothetical protein [Elusimicrobiota bacterium]